MPGLKSSRCLSSLLSPFSVTLSTAHQIPKQLVDSFLLGLFSSYLKDGNAGHGSQRAIYGLFFFEKSLQGFYGQWQVVVDRGVLFGGYA